MDPKLGQLRAFISLQQLENPVLSNVVCNVQDLIKHCEKATPFVEYVRHTITE